MKLESKVHMSHTSYGIGGKIHQRTKWISFPPVMHTRHDSAQMSKPSLNQKTQYLLVHRFLYYFLKMILYRLTCSIKLRTASAGLGKPWAEVALWTPPEIGVLNSPALVLPPVPLPSVVGDDSIFGESSKLFLWVGFGLGLVLAFRMWKKASQHNRSSHFEYPFTN